MVETTAAAALIAGMAGQYFAGRTPVPDPVLLARLGKPAEVSMRLSAVAAAAGDPFHWGCRLEDALGVADERPDPPDDWDAVVHSQAPAAPERKAQADAYWRARSLVLALQRQHAEGKKPDLDGFAVKPALEAILAAEPALSVGRVPPDPAGFERYANSAAKRLREVAASVPKREGWRCHDVERALRVIENGAERLMKNQALLPR